MFYGSRLERFESDLPALTNGESMFNSCSSLRSFTGNLPELTNGSYMFRDCYNLMSFESDLPELTNGYFMFYNCRNLMSFESDLPSLTTGSGMFQGCSLMTGYPGDLSSLSDGSNMFNGCTNLTSFTGDMPALTSGYYMFYSCGIMTTFDGTLPALTDGRYMFSNSRLSHASVKRIATSINDLTIQSRTAQIHIGVNQESLPDYMRPIYNTILSNKGWDAALYQNPAPEGWTPEQDEPVIWDASELKKSIVTTLLDNGQEIEITLEGGTLIGDATRVTDGSPWGVLNMYDAVNARDEQTVKMTIWKDDSGDYQLETYTAQDGTGKLVSVPFTTGEAMSTDFGIRVSGANAVGFSLSIDNTNGLTMTDITQIGMIGTITSITTNAATAHDPAVFGLTPENLTPEFIESQLAADKEVVVVFSGESSTAAATKKKNTETPGSSAFYADSAQTAQDVKLTFWKDEDGVTQVETWLT